MPYSYIASGDGAYPKILSTMVATIKIPYNWLAIYLDIGLDSKNASTMVEDIKYPYNGIIYIYPAMTRLPQ